MKFCTFCQTSINDAEETACPSLNYAIDTCCPWLPDDRKVKPDPKGNPYVPGTDLALAYDAGFSAAMDRARADAIRCANFYDAGSDGRNTFNILADGFVVR